MKLLGAGELAGLKARGRAKQERDPILRNTRIRTETQRAHMRALIAVPPAKFRPGELISVENFRVEITRDAPANQQLSGDDLDASLEHIGDGIALHLDPSHERLTFRYLQAVGPWSVRFTVHDDSPEASLTEVDPEPH